MSSSNQQHNTGISDLPADMRRQIAALVEHGSLPALRLVRWGWNEAANLAVRQLRRRPAQVRLVGQRWPNLEWLELELEHSLLQPDENCRGLISSLMPLMRLQHLSLAMGASLLPEGQEFILRQTRLLSLSLVDMNCKFGGSDGLLQVIGRLSHLTRLECDLQARPERLEGLPPIWLEPATDEGMRCLSSLLCLEDLTLTAQGTFTCDNSTVTGQALSPMGSLHQLTYLSLEGWLIKDTALGYLTHLQLMSLEFNYCLTLTSGCLAYMCLITSLRSLSVVASGYWSSEEQLEDFEELANEVMPFLTTLHVE